MPRRIIATRKADRRRTDSRYGGRVTGQRTGNPVAGITGERGEDDGPTLGSGRARLGSRRARARHYIRRRRALDITWRASVFVLGWGFIALGLAGLLLPVLPGWLFIFVGLGVMSTEFHWAQRLLHRARSVYERSMNRALDPRVRRRSQALVVLGVVIAAAAAWTYLVRYGLPFDIPVWLRS